MRRGQRTWPSWLVRTIIFGGIGLMLIIAIGGRFRADRALLRANQVADSGTPGEIAARAQQAVSMWSHRPSVVVSVEREADHWRAVVMSGVNCYELAVGDLVSAHPGRIACPPVQSAGSGADVLDSHDERRVTTARFLTAWLTGDPTADRFMSSDRSTSPLSDVADRVIVTDVYGGSKPTRPGARSVLTATATVEYPDRNELLAWTVVVVLQGERWSVEQVAGGEVPTGDAGPLTTGVSPVSSTSTTED